MLKSMSTVILAVAATLAGALPASAPEAMVEHVFTGPDGMNTTIFVNEVMAIRENIDGISPANTGTAKFTMTGKTEKQCKQGSLVDKTNNTSANVDDCVFIEKFLLHHYRGYWELNSLVHNQWHGLMRHKTCLLWWKASKDQNSMQFGNGDAVAFIQLMIDRFKMGLGGVYRIGGTGQAVCPGDNNSGEKSAEIEWAVDTGRPKP
ncbi:hypothetical protein BJ170DRAFT_164000 [Xylariales sp. AK1849]|nr:hypothetical protein BJ170DRAFT_164000 [Xylariales sp. AK1849]